MLKRIPWFMVVLACIVAVNSRAYSFNYVLGDALYPYSTQAQPAKGASFVDSTYNTTITRFTNIAVDNPSIPAAGGVGCGYNTYNPVSNDGARIILYGINSVPGISSYGYQLYDINGNFIADLANGKNSSPFGWYNGQDPEPRWDRSGNHNTRLYYRRNMQMRYFDVVTHEEGLQHDFANDFPAMTPATDSNQNGANMHYILSHEYGGSSTDGRYWAFYIQHSNGSQDVQDYAFVYDMVNNVVVSSKNLGSVLAIKGAMISPSGNYVLINWYVLDSNERAASDIYTRDFSAWHRCAQAIPHGNFGWTTQGHEVFTCLDGDNIAFTRCDTGERYDIYDQGSLGWNGNCLFSYTDKRGWQFVSTYAQDNSSWSYNQLWAHELDETKYLRHYPSWTGSATTGATKPRIWRVSFTQNAANVSGGIYYYQQPNAQMDYAGTKIWWGGNWRNSSGRSDVYMCSLPVDWYSGLGGVVTVDTTTIVNVSTATINLSADALSTDSIRLEWTANANNITGYSIERAVDPNKFTQVSVTNAATAVYTDTGLNPGTVYYYQVKAYNNALEFARSNTVSAATVLAISTAALSYVSVGDILVVGPQERKGIINPSKGDTAKIFFKGSAVGKFDCKIVALTGRQVWGSVMDNVSEGMFVWEAKDMPSGGYVVYVNGPGVNAKKKLAILK